MQPPFGIASRRRSSPPCPNGCGCSSGVEHDLAKVEVEGSNPFARSKLSIETQSAYVDALRRARGLVRRLLGGYGFLTCREHRNQVIVNLLLCRPGTSWRPIIFRIGREGAI